MCNALIVRALRLLLIMASAASTNLSPRHTIKLLVAVGLICNVSISGALAQQDSALPQPLNVGVYVSPPFVDKTVGDLHSGMAIDLWEASGRALGFTFQYTSYPSLRELVAATAKGEVDAAVTNLTITRDRAETIAFTQPWYDAGLRIMVPEKGGAGFWSVVSGLGSAGHIHGYLWLLGIILAATLAVTLFDRRFDPEFTRKWRHGLAESFYYVMSVATNRAGPRKNLFGWMGRIWQGLWLVVGVAVIAYVTSSVTSVMTAVSLTHGITSLSDLPGKRVAVFTGSVAEDYLRELGIASRPFSGINEAAMALQNGSIDAIVADAPVLEHYAHTHTAQRFRVVGNIFHPDKYGFAFPHESPLTRPVTLEILKLQESGALEEIRVKYFGNAK